MLVGSCLYVGDVCACVHACMFACLNCNAFLRCSSIHVSFLQLTFEKHWTIKLRNIYRYINMYIFMTDIEWLVCFVFNYMLSSVLNKMYFLFQIFPIVLA